MTGADPQIAAAIFVQNGQAVVGQARRIPLAKDGETGAVKSHEAMRRAQPEIAFRREHDPGARVLRESFFKARTTIR